MAELERRLDVANAAVEKGNYKGATKVLWYAEAAARHDASSLERIRAIAVEIQTRAQNTPRDLQDLLRVLDEDLGKLAQSGVVEEEASASAPAGWYADPASEGFLRFWDGIRWTERVSPTQGASAVTDTTPSAAEEARTSEPGIHDVLRRIDERLARLEDALGISSGND